MSGKHTKMIFEDFVPADVLQTLNRDHSEQTPGIPFVWLLSYGGKAALHNIGIFERGWRHCQLGFPVRVFFSNWTDAVLVGFVPLEAVKDPHVQEWFVTFYEVPVEEAKRRLAAFPRFPYDGRNADLVRAEMLAGGGIQKLLKRSAAELRRRGVETLARH